jgi:hypothetical protein
MKDYILAVGNAFDGLTLYGPFSEEEVAESDGDALSHVYGSPWEFVAVQPREES